MVNIEALYLVVVLGIVALGVSHAAGNLKRRK
jgi:hypothetical protein